MPNPYHSAKNGPQARTVRSPCNSLNVWKASLSGMLWRYANFQLLVAKTQVVIPLRSDMRWIMHFPCQRILSPAGLTGAVIEKHLPFDLLDRDDGRPAGIVRLAVHLFHQLDKRVRIPIVS